MTGSRSPSILSRKSVNGLLALIAWFTTMSVSAEISVSGNVISWPDDGYYQVQRSTDYVTVCENTAFCEVEAGRYNVINHTTGERFDNIEVGFGIVGELPNGIVTAGEYIHWPEDGYYQVQRSDDYLTVCEDTRYCQVEPGISYNVINHSKGIRTDFVTIPTSFFPLGIYDYRLPRSNIDQLGSVVVNTRDWEAHIIPDIDNDGKDEVLLQLRSEGTQQVAAAKLIPGNNQVSEMTLAMAIDLNVNRIPDLVLDFNGDGQSDFVTNNTGTQGDIAVRLGAAGSDLQMRLESGVDVTLNSSETTELGSAVSIGDVNGDGLDDLAIVGNDISGSVADVLYVLYGQQTPADVIDLADIAVTNYGHRIDIPGNTSIRALEVGDFDADGVDDVGLNYRISDPIVSNFGAALFFGAATGVGNTSYEPLRATPANAVTLIDTAIEGLVGDIDGNGTNDLAIYVDNGSDFPPYVLFGDRLTRGESYNSDDLADRSISLQLGFYSEFYPASLYATGDVTGDGIDDSRVTGFYNESIVLPGGALDADAIGVYLLNYNSEHLRQLTSNTIVRNGEDAFYGEPIYTFGISFHAPSNVNSTGDVNGDGIDDLVVRSRYPSQHALPERILIVPGGL